MNYFTPAKFKSLEVWFYITPGQTQTFSNPGFDAEIDFQEIYVEGHRLDSELEDHLIETFGYDWEIEIKELK